MHFSSVLLVAIFAASTARCAPALDAKTLSDNARLAQQLNAKFVNLTATDPCQGQETACIDGDIATCVDGKFDTSQGACKRTQECFAIPDIRAPGTQLLCTTENSVLRLMEAAGVDGGITGSDDLSSFPTSLPVSSSTSSSDVSPSPTPLSGSGPDDGGVDEPATVTVTVFASPLTTTTTTTISPSEASSILKNFLTEGQPPASSSSSIPSLRLNNFPSSSSTVSPIILTAAGDEVPSPTPTPTTSTTSGTVIQLIAGDEPTPSTAPTPAPAVVPTPTPTPNGVPVGGGGGGGGYGY